MMGGSSGCGLCCSRKWFEPMHIRKIALIGVAIGH